jgi:hypothetical protein
MSMDDPTDISTDEQDYEVYQQGHARVKFDEFDHGGYAAGLYWWDEVHEKWVHGFTFTHEEAPDFLELLSEALPDD